MAGIDVVRVASWQQYRWLRHGFSTRQGGASTVYGGLDLNLGFTMDDEDGRVRQNRRQFLREVASDRVELGELVTVRQVHGVAVKTVAEGEPGLRNADGKAIVEADGLMTSAAGVMLGIQVADCVPVLVADVRRRVVMALHAGWRGTAAGMVERGIGRMVDEFGSRSADLIAAVGPSIGACCYTVGDEVWSAFTDRFHYAQSLFSKREDGLHVDLSEANRRQLLAAGLRPNQVTVLGECTACARVAGNRKYFSHRAERGVTGRAMGMIGIVPK